MLSPLDDFPVHQTAEPVLVVATSDRNFYDRYYFNLFHVGGDVVVTAGLGQYPNLGVVDGFLSVTTTDRQDVVRASRELGADRLDTSVGPISVNVIKGLSTLELRVGPNDSGIELDVVWEPSIPAFLEARHQNRRGARITTDTSRFAQTGFWRGTLVVRDTTYEIDAAGWRGGRDRSWGIRPVGEPEPVVRRHGEEPGGFLWLYCTMQFEGSTIVCILQEDQHGRRSLEQAARVWSDPARGVDDLGRPEHEIVFVDGTRQIERMTLRLCALDRPDVVIEAAPIGASYLALGTGYGNEREWRHGMYQGPLEVQHRQFDLGDHDVRATSYGLIDAIARYSVDGEVGYGLMEHAVLGPNDRYGFGRR